MGDVFYTPKMLKQKRRALEKQKAKELWMQLKDFILLLFLLNTLIGLLSNFNIAEVVDDTMVQAVVIDDKKQSPFGIELAQASSPDNRVAEFTGYSAGDGFTPGVTMASGKKVYVGAIACPIKYEFGTKIEVNGKIYTCEDTMAKRFRDGEYFDIYFDDINDALNFGRKQLNYKVIK